MRYLVVDGELGGTGIRDKYANGYSYVKPKELGLSQGLISQIDKWKKAYEQVHYNGYKEKDIIERLDMEGINIAKKIIEELQNIKVEYYSDAYLTTYFI